MEPTPEKNIAYIIASSHSGSTLLSALLGAQAGIISLGETDVFSAESKSYRPLEERICSCQHGNWRQCYFWQSVDQQLRQQSGLSLDALDLSSADPQLFYAHQTAFWTAISSVVAEPVIVDSSKKIDLYRRLVALPFQIIPIYLIRSPFGVVYSQQKKGKNWLRESIGYLHFHMNAQLALRNQKYIHVRYEDLVSDPEACLRNILSELNQPVAHPELNWRLQVQHLLRGNSMILKKDTTIRHDDEWKYNLSWFQKAGIYCIVFPLRLRSMRFFSVYVKIHAACKRALILFIIKFRSQGSGK